MAKREKTKHKGIYRVGDMYYITYYADGKKWEKAIGPKLDQALDEKRKMERRPARESTQSLSGCRKPLSRN